MKKWNSGWSCIIHRFMSSPNDVCVAVKMGGKSMRYSVGDKSKEYFCDLGIDSILFNALMQCAVNTGLYRISDLR